MTLRTTLGHRLRHARKCRGLTLQNVAAQVGVNMQQIAKYELGESAVTVDRLVLMGMALGVEASELVRGL